LIIDDTLDVMNMKSKSKKISLLLVLLGWIIMTIFLYLYLTKLHYNNNNNNNDKSIVNTDNISFKQKCADAALLLREEYSEFNVESSIESETIHDVQRNWNLVDDLFYNKQDDEQAEQFQLSTFTLTSTKTTSFKMDFFKQQEHVNSDEHKKYVRLLKSKQQEEKELRELISLLDTGELLPSDV
jgi:hypothetical protein